MSAPIVIFTDKVMRMIKSMVVFAMRASYRRGVTAGELSGFLGDWALADAGSYHEGVVERALDELHREGMIARVGARWYPVGIAH